MSYDEFLNSTPRIVRSFNELEIRWQENLMINVYIKTHTVSNLDNKQEDKRVIDGFGDLLG